MRVVAFLVLASALMAAPSALAKERATAKDRHLQSVERSDVTNKPSSEQKRGRNQDNIDGSAIRVEQLIPDICKGCS